MKKKTQYLYLSIKLLIIEKLKLLWLILICRSPWYSALILSTWNMYKKSNLFRQRWIEFNQRTAVELYTLNEHHFFIDKVKKDKELMKKIIFHPFQVLNEDTAYDFELRQFIKLERK